MYTLEEDRSGWKVCKDVASNVYVLVELLLPKGTIVYQPNPENNPVCGQAITVQFWIRDRIADEIKTASSFMTSSAVLYERGKLSLARASYHEIPGYDGLHFFWSRAELYREAHRYGLPSSCL